GTNGGFLASLLQLPRPVRSLVERRRGAQSLKAAEVMASPTSGVAPHLLPPLDLQEVWAAGVTYERSRVARMEETAGAETFYDKVYSAERPELFFKGAASRVSGHNGPIRIRRDASWNVPEPEIAVLVSAHGEIAGYTVGNDVSSRDIEGENPLYLPQARIYRESCALGPVVWLTDEDTAPIFDIAITIQRRGAVVYEGKIATSAMRRSFEDLADWLARDTRRRCRRSRTRRAGDRRAPWPAARRGRDVPSRARIRRDRGHCSRRSPRASPARRCPVTSTP